MRFTCGRCGKRYASTDEPVPGRIYAIGCRCGHTIVVKGPELSGGVRSAASVQGAVRDDPFAGLHARGLQAQPLAGGAAALGAGAASPLPAWAVSAGPAVSSALPAAARRSAAPAPRPSEAPAPAERPYDPVAASHGLLLDVEQARALSGGSMGSGPLPLPVGTDDEEVSVTFSDRLPLFATKPTPRSWILGSAAVLAALVIVGGAFALMMRHPSPDPPRAPPHPAPEAASAAHTAPAPPPVASRPSPAAEARAPAAATPTEAEPPPPERAPAATAPEAAPARRSVAPAPAAREPRPERRRPPPRPAAAPPPAEEGEEADGAEAAAAPRPEPAGRDLPGAADVAEAVQRNRGAFDLCGEEAAALGTRLIGRRILLGLTVNPSGIVTAPQIDDPEIDNSPTGACLRAAARKVVLPSFEGEPVRVQVPIVLRP
jgi:hypothetical protein